MLTYDSLRKIVTEERSSNAFVKLPDNFLEQASAYIEMKEKGQEAQWEIDSAKRFFKDLLEIRERKLLLAASYAVHSGARPDHLLASELSLFNEVVALLKASKKQETGEKPKEKKKATNSTTIEMLQDLPEFVGSDLKTYGPLKTGEHARLPNDVSALLIEKKAAKVAKEG